jgi:hypothetical protein
VTVAYNLKTELVNDWQLGTPLSSADIEWTNYRKQVGVWQGAGTKKILIAVFNPGTTSSRPLSANWWRIDEQVRIDVLIKVGSSGGTSTIDTDYTNRDTIRNEILRIVHLKQTGITGVNFAYPTREPIQNEAENLLYLTIFVNCVYFHQKT